MAYSEGYSRSAGRPRSKVPGKGGLFQWLKLTKTSTRAELSGVSWEPTKSLTLEEISKHNSPDDCWVILRGAVYNVTEYLAYHPGGADEILRAAGRSGDQLFDDIHAWVNVEGFLELCRVGVVSASASGSGGGAMNSRVALLSGGGRTPKNFDTATIKKIEQVNHNTKRFFLSTERPFKYAFGQHVKVQLNSKGGKLVSRPYTPLTSPESQSALEFIIKIYPDGEVTPIIDKLTVGDQIKYSLAGAPANLAPVGNLSKLYVVAAGTGIAPFVPIMAAFLAHEKTSSVTLIFSNTHEDDILLRNLFEDWRQSHGEKFNAHFVLSNPNEKWTGLKGRIDAEKLKAILPPPPTFAHPGGAAGANSFQVLICGPVRMVNDLSGTLKGMNYPNNLIVPFT